MIVVEGGFDDVFQLPDVAGPVIGQKDILYLAAVCHDLLVEFLVVVLAEILHQQGDIPLPPVQLRDIVPQHTQAVEDILPDLIPLYAALRVLVDGGDDPHVHLLFLLEPTGITALVSRTRSSLACAVSSMELISSRNRVPPSASSNRPGVSLAPV